MNKSRRYSSALFQSKHKKFIAVSIRQQKFTKNGHTLTSNLNEIPLTVDIKRTKKMERKQSEKRNKNVVETIPKVKSFQRQSERV